MGWCPENAISLDALPSEIVRSIVEASRVEGGGVHILAPGRIPSVLCFERVTAISTCWAVPGRSVLREPKDAILAPVRNAANERWA